MSAIPVPRSLKGRHLKIVALFVGVGLVNSLDRATLAVANPLIRHDLGISVSQMGLLLSAFFWAYAWTQLPLGLVMDRLGARKMLGIAVLFWSAMQALAGLSANFAQLFTFRMLLGAGESPQVPSCAKVVRIWFGPRDRGWPTGILTGSFQIATAFGVPLLTLIMLAFSWRTMFIVMGCLGVLAGTVWLLVYRDPSNAALTAEESEYLAKDNDAAPTEKMTWQRWKKLLTCRTTLGLIFGFIGYHYLDTIYRVWLPGYLEIQHHLSIGKTGMVAAIPLTCSILGSLSGGFFADFLARRSVTAFNSGRIPCIIGTGILAVMTLALAFTQSLVGAVIFLSIASWASHMSGSAAWVLVSAAAPQDSIGSLGGMQNCVGSTAGAIASIATGYLVQATGSFFSALVIGVVVAVVATIVYIVIPNKPITSDDLASEPQRDVVAA